MCSPQGELLCTNCNDPACLRCPEETGWLVDFCKDIDPARPAEYKIDYVRVYQDTSDPKHTIGCSPPDFPTREYIDDNWEKYTFDPWVMDAPLQPVQHGGGSCKKSSECGNYLAADSFSLELFDEEKMSWEDFVKQYGGPLRQSVCVDGTCRCTEEWTGPNCFSPCLGHYENCQGGAGGSSAAAKAGVSFVFVVLAALLM